MNTWMRHAPLQPLCWAKTVSLLLTNALWDSNFLSNARTEPWELGPSKVDQIRVPQSPLSTYIPEPACL